MPFGPITIACRSDIPSTLEAQVKGDCTPKWRWGEWGASAFPNPFLAISPTKVSLALRSLSFLAINAPLLKGGRAGFAGFRGKTLLVAGGFELL